MQNVRSLSFLVHFILVLAQQKNLSFFFFFFAGAVLGGLVLAILLGFGDFVISIVLRTVFVVALVVAGMYMLMSSSKSISDKIAGAIIRKVMKKIDVEFHDVRVEQLKNIRGKVLVSTNHKTEYLGSFMTLPFSQFSLIFHIHMG
jgi:uncharacterized membrane protein (DUF485 family)